MTTRFSDGASIWNQRFAGTDYLFGRQPNEFLRAHTGLLPPGAQVLCVADGEGRNSVWLARQGLQVDAFDISEVGVAKARKLAAEAGVSVNYTVADCDHWKATTPSVQCSSSSPIRRCASACSLTWFVR
jgi:2-polyprenyl-3-methyl-5-hydroxy-6-metoxy-1,4-benzoquinol methylase